MTIWRDENGIPVAQSGEYAAWLIDWRVLEEMPTLSEGQADDCKIDTTGIPGRRAQRVWLSRMSRVDGEHCDHHVSVETFDPGSGAWLTTSEN